MKGSIAVGRSSNDADVGLGSRSGIAMRQGGDSGGANEYIIYSFTIIGTTFSLQQITAKS